MITRKRVWYSVRDHLQNYGEFTQLQPAIRELHEHGFILCPESVHSNLIEQFKAKQSDAEVGAAEETRQQSETSDFELEPLSQLLDSMTLAKLTEISKVATKCIRKVTQTSILENLHEVAPYNPFYNYYAEHLQPMLQDASSARLNESLLGRLKDKVRKVSLAYSGHYIEYMTQNERKFKSQISRRKLVQKILRRVHGLLRQSSQPSCESSVDSQQRRG